MKCILKYFGFLFRVVFIGILFGCKNPASNSAMSINDEPTPPDTLLLSGKRLVLKWGAKDLPQRIYPLNEAGLKDGLAFKYGEQGAISAIAKWKNGIQDGNTFLFEVGNLKTHQVFDAGKLLYEADYVDQLKTENKLYPWVIEEFFFEDKYYAKIRFLLSFQGTIKIEVKRYQAVITSLPDQTFQLVINDALDLNGFDLLLTYHATAQDTLLDAEYTHKHLVYGDK